MCVSVQHITLNKKIIKFYKKNKQNQNESEII